MQPVRVVESRKRDKMLRYPIRVGNELLQQVDFSGLEERNFCQAGMAVQHPCAKIFLIKTKETYSSTVFRLFSQN